MTRRDCSKAPKCIALHRTLLPHFAITLAPFALLSLYPLFISSFHTHLCIDLHITANTARPSSSLLLKSCLALFSSRI
jgi:hypothetical protein